MATTPKRVKMLNQTLSEDSFKGLSFREAKEGLDAMLLGPFHFKIEDRDDGQFNVLRYVPSGYISYCVADSREAATMAAFKLNLNLTRSRMTDAEFEIMVRAEITLSFFDNGGETLANNIAVTFAIKHNGQEAEATYTPVTDKSKHVFKSSCAVGKDDTPNDVATRLWANLPDPVKSELMEEAREIFH